MTRLLLGALVAAMLTLTGLVTYHTVCTDGCPVCDDVSLTCPDDTPACCQEPTRAACCQQHSASATATPDCCQEKDAAAKEK
jgi:hypothetical protein